MIGFYPNFDGVVNAFCSPSHYFALPLDRKKLYLSRDAMESSMRLSPSKTIARPAEAAACVRRLVEDDVS